MDESKSQATGVGRARESGAGFPSQNELLTGLLRRSVSGDQSAFGSLYDETIQIVFGLALRMLGNREDAEEVALDVYGKAWQSASRYDSQRGSVLAWLIMMTRSAAIDRIRSRASLGHKEAPTYEAASVHSGAPGPEEDAWRSQRRERVAMAIQQLPSDQMKAIQLAFFHGLTHSELAERLGEPLGTVKTRIRLGLIRLRYALGDWK
ncbi:MAG: sigma-70 family RNA polymerase sigma factor [Bryobacteraceae bacterium]